MDMRLLRHAVLGAVLLCITAAPAVALAQSRTPPQGDNLAGFVQVPLNASKTVYGIESATLEGLDVEDTVCDVSSASQYSVWFGFDVPEGMSAMVDIENGGSVFVTANSASTRVRTTLYKQDALLTELDCEVDGRAIVGAELDAGAYRIRIAAKPNEPLIAPSRYVATVRVRALWDLLEDTHFEDSELGVAWTTNDSGDPAKIFRVCDLTCGVRFDGIAGGQLTQTVRVDPAELRFKAGDILEADIYVNSTPDAGADIKLTVKIVYANGTPTTKAVVTRHVTFPTTFGSIMSFGRIYAEIQHKSVRRIKFIVTSPQATDTFKVDITTLRLFYGTSLRALPPSP